MYFNTWYGYIKMFVIEDLKSSTVYEKVVEAIESQSVIDTDNSNSYTNLRTLVKEHRPQIIHPKEVDKLLPWVHIAISNAKRLLLDIFHDIKPEYLQSYLNEFCYKFNRRYFGENLFDRLMIAAVTNKNQFRYNIEQSLYIICLSFNIEYRSRLIYLKTISLISGLPALSFNLFLSDSFSM